ncbi:DUF1320 domain-containing protein [Pendulispora brunnea]|uniref:DUF1320 domain-containing protein n=1 Tax=Pendulispora brunnea TaxID=2905690 RepID=A0ABZ2K7A8_9BACT
MNYATRADLAQYGLTAQALAVFTDEQQERALRGASATADGYLRSRYSLPLADWDDDLRRNVCLLAAYDLMASHGVYPDGIDETLRLRAESAVGWLKSVSSGVVTIAVAETPPVINSPAVMTTRKRGW